MMLSNPKQSTRSASTSSTGVTRIGKGQGIRITLKSRADMAAAAIVKRIIMRSRPRVFLLVVPRKSGSAPVVAAMMAWEENQGRGRKELVCIAVAAAQSLIHHPGEQIMARWSCQSWQNTVHSKRRTAAVCKIRPELTLALSLYRRFSRSAQRALWSVR